MISIVNYSKLFVIIAIICLKFYNVLIRLILIIVLPSYYCQLFWLLRLFVIIVFIVLICIIVLIEIIGIYVIACALRGWYKMWMADIRCSLTDLGGQYCDGEEFQPKHPGVLSEKVIGCSLGLHTSCQWMPVDGGDSQLRV